MFPLEALEKKFFSPCPVCSVCWRSLACAQTSASVVLHSALCQTLQCALHKILDTAVRVYPGNLTQLGSTRGFLGGQDGNEYAWNAEDPGSVPGEENGNPLQFLPGESPDRRS